MLEKYDKPLRLACLVLGLILFSQVVRIAVRRDPLTRLNIPEIPALAASKTDAPPALGAAVPPPAPPKADKPSGTNTPAAGTNAVAVSAAKGANTNAASAKKPESGAAAAGPVPPPSGRPPRMGPGGMMPGGMTGGGPPLPPLVQARIDKIIQSELLAPIIRPLPMALLGIAGSDVFLRTSNGQTGIVKEGGELGGVKLLRVGLNRVLVEENGEKKELTIYSGFGSESLLPKQNENSK